jgi:hypothetical protein
MTNNICLALLRNSQESMFSKTEGVFYCAVVLFDLSLWSLVSLFVFSSNKRFGKFMEIIPNNVQWKAHSFALIT